MEKSSAPERPAAASFGGEFSERGKEEAEVKGESVSGKPPTSPRLRAIGEGASDEEDLEAVFDEVDSFPNEYVGVLQGVADESSRLSNTETRNKRRAAELSVFSLDGWDRLGSLVVLLALVGALFLNFPQRLPPQPPPRLLVERRDDFTNFDFMLRVAGSPKGLLEELETEQVFLSGYWRTLRQSHGSLIQQKLDMKEEDLLQLLKTASDLLTEHRELEGEAKRRQLSEIRVHLHSSQQKPMTDRSEVEVASSEASAASGLLSSQVAAKLQQSYVHVLVERQRLTLAALRCLRLRMEEVVSQSRHALEGNQKVPFRTYVAALQEVVESDERVAQTLDALLDRKAPIVKGELLKDETAQNAEIYELADALSAAASAKSGSKEETSFNTSNVLRLLTLARSRVDSFRWEARAAAAEICDKVKSTNDGQVASEDADIEAVKSVLRKFDEARDNSRALSKLVKTHVAPSENESIAESFCRTTALILSLL